MWDPPSNLWQRQQFHFSAPLLMPLPLCVHFVAYLNKLLFLLLLSRLSYKYNIYYIIIFSLLLRTLIYIFSLKLEALYSYVWWLCEFSREAKSSLSHLQSQNHGKKNLGFGSTKSIKVCALVLFFVTGKLGRFCLFFLKRGYAAISLWSLLCNVGRHSQLVLIRRVFFVSKN